MNRFVIVDGLPYLYANGSTFAVKWDEKGFTVGDEVQVDFIPNPLFTAREVKAKCLLLDSIGASQEESQDDDQDDSIGASQEESQELTEMSLAKLKAYAKAQGVKLGSARTKAEIIEAIDDHMTGGASE